MALETAVGSSFALAAGTKNPAARGAKSESEEVAIGGAQNSNPF
jgi:hypothetical protein